MTELLLSIMGFYFNEVTQVSAMSWLPHVKGVILPEGCCNPGAQETGKEFTKLPTLCGTIKCGDEEHSF